MIRSSKQTAVRYERARPGELVHMDVKKLGRIPKGGGWRGDGGTRVNHLGRPDQRTRIGYDYVHSLVDDHSRAAYSEVPPDEKGATCAGFLRRAAAFFATIGIDRVETIMTAAVPLEHVIASRAPCSAPMRCANSTSSARAWLP